MKALLVTVLLIPLLITIALPELLTKLQLSSWTEEALTHTAGDLGLNSASASGSGSGSVSGAAELVKVLSVILSVCIFVASSLCTLANSVPGLIEVGVCKGS